MKVPTEFVVLGLVSLPGVVAWGDLGHYTTAYVASHFVSNSTAAYLKKLLNNDNDDYLAGIAMFGDKYKFTHQGSFTRTFHFIDAHDKPYKDCNVDYDRDCKDTGCVISALANYTAQALDQNLVKKDSQLAVKLLVHYIGDLHQPLHNEDVGKGGTQIFVEWKSHQEKLHGVWDSSIPETVAKHLKHGRNDLEWAEEWANELSNEISNGKFASEKKSWLKSFDLSDPLQTAMEWSIEANKLVCSHGEDPHGDKLVFHYKSLIQLLMYTVFPKPWGPKEIEGQQLSGHYYDEAGPIVEEQIARAGYRMAAWLDEIARNHPGEEPNAEL
ncbi:S1/P1 nuclease [Trichoderma velutinum]